MVYNIYFYDSERDTVVVADMDGKQLVIDCKDDDLIDVKEVRNLYTHNNPKTMVSQRQWYNSTHIIQLALIEGIKYIFGMENKECKGFYLHIAKGGKEEKKRFNV